MAGFRVPAQPGGAHARRGGRSFGDYVLRANGQGDAAIRAEAAGPAAEALRKRSPEEPISAPPPHLSARASTTGRPPRRRPQHAGVVARVKPSRVTAPEETTRAAEDRVALWLFDCINCDKCVPSAPTTPTSSTRRPRSRPRTTTRGAGGPRRSRGGRRVRRPEGPPDRQLPGLLQRGGNCDVFCRRTAALLEKPRFFGSLQLWVALRGRDGYFTARHDGQDAMWGRVRGREYRLEVDRGTGRGRFSDGVITVDVDHRRGVP